MSGLTRDLFGATAASGEVAVFTLTHDGGAVVRLLEIGAVIAGFEVPDRTGVMADVVLGFDTVAEYEANPAYFGCATGRVANRIAGGRFELDGRVVQLAVNSPPNHIHGGEGGFHRALWRGEAEDTLEGPGVRFRRVSPDGEDGYPGTLSVEILYTLTRANGLRIDYLATTDRPTPVNLTNHSYFHLGGHGAGSVLDHVISIKASRCTARDDTGLPGAIQPVEGTPLDLRDPARVGGRIDALSASGGFDHNYVVDRWDGEACRLVAEVIEPLKGRRMEVFTTQPGVQLYTANVLGPTRGKAGAAYDRHCALCLETQHFPDSVNRPDFPNTILRPGQIYRETTEYRFSTL